MKSLDQDAQDTLMKYLYKGMAMPGWGDVSGSVLLGWHEKVKALFTDSALVNIDQTLSSSQRLRARDALCG